MLPHCFGLSWIVGDPPFFWRDVHTYWYLGCSNPYSLKLLFAICAAVMDVLRCFVLGLQGNLGPGGLNGTCKYEGGGSYYTECASSNLHSRLLIETMLVKKRRFMLMQESKEVLLDWSLIEKYLVGLNMNGKDEQEKTSNLQTQHQVGTTS